jgi:hypothetical protein
LYTISLELRLPLSAGRATVAITNMAEENDSPTAAPPSPKKPKLENKVELQKERALALWEKTVASGSVPNDVDESVRAHLDKGEVLPIFHTMVRGGGSPFPFESHSHELSHVNPKKGSAIPKRKDGNNEIPELDLDDPSLDVFSLIVQRNIKCKIMRDLEGKIMWNLWRRKRNLECVMALESGILV